jgi:hypothetical protein
MILCRKPCVLFDVDVIAGAILLVIALASYFGVIRPAYANAAGYRDLAAKIEAANAQVSATSEKLSVVHGQVERLREGVALQSEAAPKADALTPFLGRIADLADECGVTIAQVAPRPLRRNDGYLSGDIFFTGTGGSLGFARLLNRLSCEHPYFTLEEYSLKRAAGAGSQACELVWTLRLYMLEEGAADRKGGQP